MLSHTVIGGTEFFSVPADNSLRLITRVSKREKKTLSRGLKMRIVGQLVTAVSYS
jgi:hypothetical protein